jgi:tetratricopeptide (TPR) repeat protein
VIAANGLADTQTAAAQGRVAARRAIEIDPAAAEAFAALGLIQSVADWDWPGADASFRQAIASNPNCANAYQWQAHNLLWQARFPEALAAIQKALDLDSLSPVILSNQAEFAYFMHDYSKALQLYQHTLDLNPGFISANIEIGMTLNRMGRQREAIRCFEKARSLSSEEASPLVGLAIANANLGNIPEAKRLLDQLQADSKVLHVSNFQFATMYAALGDTDRAISALERSYAEHEGFLIAIKVHPDLDPLRSDPRFAALQRKMRL